MSEKSIPVKEITLTELQPSGYNPRKISEEQYDALKRSMEEFGFVEPILVDLNDDMRIVGGHQRFNVLLDKLMDGEIEDKMFMLPMGKVGWVFTDTNLSIKDMAHQMALNVALNKTGGEFDVPKLQSVFEDLNTFGFDLDLTGFEKVEVQELFTTPDDDGMGDDLISDFENVDIDNMETDFCCPKCGYEWSGTPK